MDVDFLVAQICSLINLVVCGWFGENERRLHFYSFKIGTPLHSFARGSSLLLIRAYHSLGEGRVFHAD